MVFLLIKNRELAFWRVRSEQKDMGMSALEFYSYQYWSAHLEPECSLLPDGLLAEIDDFAGVLTTRQTRLLAYWNKRRGNRSMPARRDLDPAQIRSLLPNLVLIDVAAGCTDFRFRLLGTAVAAQCVRDHTGKRFSEL